jgi:hypothetical protein
VVEMELGSEVAFDNYAVVFYVHPCLKKEIPVRFQPLER